MKKMIKNFAVLGLVAPFFIACSADEPEMDSSLNVSEGLHQTYDIQSEDLVGTWRLLSMKSEVVPVDLNLDGIESTDILSETPCFQEMYFNFKLDGSVATQQAKLYFDTASGKMECKYGFYNAEYEVNGNELKVGFQFGGSKVYETRIIDVYEENSDQFLQMDLTYEEAREYIKDTTFVSPTGATNVKAVQMLYKKEKQ